MVFPGHVDDVTRQLRDSGMKVRVRTRNVQKSVTFALFTICRMDILALNVYVYFKVYLINLETEQ